MSDKIKEIAVYIDGGNFYQRLKELDIPGKGNRFNYSAFIDSLCRGRKLVDKRYYVGIVRNYDHTPKSQLMVEAQQKFLSNLEKDGITIKRGHIVYDHSIREKGVDVKLAVDLVIGAVDDLYDEAVVVSSDTDLIPAIKYVQYKGKAVEYVGFSNRPSLGMTRESSLSILLLKDDLQNFVEPKQSSKS